MLGLGNSLCSEGSQLEVRFSNNYSMSFDGVDDFIQVDSVAGKIDKDRGTIAFWINLPTVSTTGFIFRAQSGSSSSTDDLVQMIYHASQNEMRISYKGGGSTTRTAAITDGHTSIEEQGWKHIVGTWDTSVPEVKIYMNGDLIATNSGSLTAHTSELDNADIGRNAGSTAAPLKATIDELAIFNTVVSASDLYNDGVVKDLSTESGLKAYWRFEEGSGTQATDSSGGNHTGAISGASYSTSVP